MNKSIITASETATDERVKELTRQLMVLAGKRVRITFTKKDGTVRVMDCVPRNQYNSVLGIVSTEQGKKRVANNARKGMITVAEIVEGANGTTTFQCRTVNLKTTLSIEPIGC